MTTPDPRQFIPSTYWEIHWLESGATGRYYKNDLGRVFLIDADGSHVIQPIAPWTVAINAGRDFTARQLVRQWTPDGDVYRAVDALPADGCACGHGAELHAAEANPFMCMVCGDNTRCDYDEPEVIAADRWDEGWSAAVIALCPYPPSESNSRRLLWAMEHMPQDNPYRADDEMAETS
jgi:hypothetical protein